MRGRPKGLRSRRIDLRPGEGPIEQPQNYDVAFSAQVWSPRYNLIALLASSGLKNKEIAQHLEVSEQTVSNVINDPRAREVIIEAQRRAADNVLDLNKRIKTHCQEALDEIVDELRSSEDERIRQKAAFGLLDRGGYTPVQQHVVKAAPELPAGLVERVTETHAELRQITREFRYTAPQPTEPAPTGQDVTDLSTGTDG